MLFVRFILSVSTLGRFEEAIIEERRKAALELLNFLGSQAHLFNSLAVQEFFEVRVTFRINIVLAAFLGCLMIVFFNALFFLRSSCPIFG